MASLKNIFNTIALPKVATNRFDLSHDVKTSFQMGELIPTCVMECLPGDKFSINVENFLRFAPLISPVMHKVRVTTHYFFVPNRILWPEWEKWITGESDVEAPYCRIQAGSGIINSIESGSIADYMGYPTDSTGPSTEWLDVSPIPWAGFLKIYDEFYRDQNLQPELFQPLVPGDNSASDWTPIIGFNPLRRAWQHDYFTSALPFAQKGDAVQVPLTIQDDIPIQYTPGQGVGDNVIVRRTSDDAPLTGVDVTTDNSGQLGAGGPPSGTLARLDMTGTHHVDVQSDAVDINTLRRAFRLQEWLERNARGGTRYIENILAHFGVRSSDSRLQRPEYIGGSKQNMVISEVLATAETTDAGVSVGTMAGHGISVGGGNTFNYRCEEHGFIIGIINVQPDTAYQQGLHRQFSRFDKLDYAWPTFANLGEQEILNKELFVDSTNAVKAGTFGYIPRYSEYKYMNSRVSGEMRYSLDFWHLGRIFATQPALNSDFITANPDTRIFAVEDNVDHIYAHIFNNISAVRKLPRFGIPTI